MKEPTSEEKQQYLRENILDKNEIDANKFVEFLKEKKGEEGADISNWTMEDLKEVVKEFYQVNNVPIKENIDNFNKDLDKKEINEIEEQNKDIDVDVIKEEIKNVEVNNNIINDKTNINDKKKENSNKLDENMTKDYHNNKDEKEESIKFIIDEDSLLDFMLTEKGIKKNTEKTNDNKNIINNLPIQNKEENKANYKTNKNVTNNNNQQFNFEKNFNNNNYNLNNNYNNDIKDINSNQNYNNNSLDNDNKQFNFDKNFKNNVNDTKDNTFQFNFYKNFNNNNVENDKQQFNFDKNISNNSNLGNEKKQFNFDKNFKNNNLNTLNNNVNIINNENAKFEEHFKDNNNNPINNIPNYESNNDKYNSKNNNQKKEAEEIIEPKTENCNNSESNKISINTSKSNNDNNPNIIEDNSNLNNNNKNIDSKSDNSITNENNKNIYEEVNKQNYVDDNIKNPNLTNMIDKDDHDSEYGIIIQDLIKTKKIDNTEFSNHKDIIIKLSDPIKVDQSFFLGKSVNYLVTTSPFNYAVRRRYSDFNWLRETLINLFNTNIIPKITKKGKVTTDKHDDLFIQKRMKYLEKFINFLIKDELIKSSLILYEFLTIQKEEDFQQRKKYYDKLKISPLIDIKERQSINGELKIKITKEKEIYLENIKDNTIYNSNLFKKLNNNFKLLKDEFLIVIKRFESISDIYRQLYDVSKNYLDQNLITESYNQMDIMFKKLSESFDTLKQFINSDIREYFKFVGNNFTILNEMTQNVDLSKNNYIKISKNLISKKNDLYRKGDISKWELSQKDKYNAKQLLKDKYSACNKMLPKETNICINAKEIYGYYLNRLINEYERMRKINSGMHKKKVSFYCKEQIVICSEYTRILGDIIMSLDSCKPKL